MPFLPEQKTTATLTQHANALVQVLEQLTAPSSGVAVAHPDGMLLAANDQVHDFYRSESLSYNGAAVNLQQLLCLTQEEYGAMIEAVMQQEVFSGETQNDPTPGAPAYTYSCRLMHFQEEAFLCVDLALAGKFSVSPRCCH